MHDEVLVKMALLAWEGHQKRADTLFDALSDEQLAADVAPGRNSGTYLLGHLTAVHDYLFPILGLGERLHPDLEAPFLTNPDKAGLTAPPVAELRAYWREVSRQLATRLGELSVGDWFGRHSTISEADFAREPHRNKLNVLLNRTTHLSYHLGQLVLLR